MYGNRLPIRFLYCGCCRGDLCGDASGGSWEGSGSTGSRLGPRLEPGAVGGRGTFTPKCKHPGKGLYYSRVGSAYRKCTNLGLCKGQDWQEAVRGRVEEGKAATNRVVISNLGVHYLRQNTELT